MLKLDKVYLQICQPLLAAWGSREPLPSRWQAASFKRQCLQRQDLATRGPRTKTGNSVTHPLQLRWASPIGLSLSTTIKRVLFI